MKRVLVIIAVSFFVLFSPVSEVKALSLNLPGDRMSQLTPEDRRIFNTLQSILLRQIDSAIATIDRTQVYLENIFVPPGYTCDSDTDLQTIEDYLYIQRKKIEEASNLTELRQLRRETIDHLRNNRGKIENELNTQLDCSYNATVQSINTYLRYARIKAGIMQSKGEDVEQLRADIETAQEIVNNSEEEYLQADTYRQKVAAYRLLAEASPYLRSIQSEMNP